MKRLPFLCLFLASSVLADPSFAPWSYTDKDLFPSAIISTATVDWNGDEETAEDKKPKDAPKLKKKDLPIYGDENGWLAVDLSGLPKGAEVAVEITVDGYLKPAKWKGIIERSLNGEARIFPKAAWDYEALLKVRQQRPVNATFKVSVNGQEIPEQTQTCNMRSLNDCPFYVLWDEEGEEFEDFSWLFAAYVNENHPLVDSILKEALSSGVVSSFTGYQSDDADEVLSQVFAIWQVLQRRGIKYSDISTTTPSKFVVSQTVRLLDQSLENSQANCVDGSVLMASLLHKIGIKSYLVMVPGHCFLAFETSNDDDAEIVGLETTMLGDNDLKPIKDLPHLPEKLKQKEFKESYETFLSAIDTGNTALEENAEAFDSEEDPDTQLISISDARELGITPIASEK
jgi:hypothetical protein